MKEGLIAGIARQRNGEKKEGKMEREREREKQLLSREVY